MARPRTPPRSPRSTGHTDRYAELTPSAWFDGFAADFASELNELIGIVVASADRRNRQAANATAPYPTRTPHYRRPSK